MSFEKWIKKQKERGLLDGELTNVNFEELYLYAKVGFKINPDFIKSLETPKGRKEALMKLRERKELIENLLDRM